MFGIFRITKDANKAHGFLANFVGYARDSLSIFGFARGAELVSTSEWAAGPNLRNERGITYLSFRLAVPFSSFFASIDNDTLSGQPSEKEANIRIEGSEDFQGFGLNAYTERELIQVYAMNRPSLRVTARAAMLMARFKSKGATDITNILRGKF
jgi:hypothetical protein